MKTTRIYSCGPDARLCANRVAWDNPVWFPEISVVGPYPIPVHPAAQIELVPSLVGKTIITMSEHIILAFLRMIADGDMDLSDFQLYCSGRRIRVDGDGELIDKWDGGFFCERAQLLF